VNPWRASRPSGHGNSLTKRTLTHERKENAHNTKVFKNTVNGITFKYVGPSSTATGAIHNRIIAVNNQWRDTAAQLRNEAVLDMIASVKDQKWNAGVMLAESAGVATMVVDAATLIAKTRHLLRHGDFAEAYRRFRKAKPDIEAYPSWRRRYLREGGRDRIVRRAKKIPQGWLYYHFGIKPTVNDIDDAITSFMSRKDQMAYEYGGLARGYAKHTYKDSVTGRLGSSDPEHGTYTISVLYSVRTTCYVKPKPGFTNRLTALGVTNPPEALWNAIPFSWLVDYFSSVGEWLSVLDMGLGWDFETFWSESWREAIDCKFVAASGGGVTYLGQPLPSTLKRKILTRNVRGDLYGPMGSVLPMLKRKGPSAKRIANVLSVLASAFGGGPRQ
jgi:hypothetical protein